MMMLPASVTLCTWLLVAAKANVSNDNTEPIPKPIIIDTDIFSDVDDIGALAVANALHNCGKADLQAVIINTPSEYGSLAASVRIPMLHHPPYHHITLLTMPSTRPSTTTSPTPTSLSPPSAL
jgi:hypothetical protein